MMDILIAFLVFWIGSLVAVYIGAAKNLAKDVGDPRALPDRFIAGLLALIVMPLALGMALCIFSDDPLPLSLGLMLLAVWMSLMYRYGKEQASLLRDVSAVLYYWSHSDDEPMRTREPMIEGISDAPRVDDPNKYRYAL